MARSSRSTRAAENGISVVSGSATSWCPLNSRYPLRELAAACHEWRRARNRRLSIEWAMIDGVNDTERDAAEFAAFALPLQAHVNLSR